MTPTFPRTRALALAAATCGLLSTGLVPTAGAVPFTTDLVVTTTMTFDTAFAASATGTQAGSMNVIAGGVAAASTYSGDVVTGANPRNGTLTDIGDGLGISSTASAGPAAAGNTFAVGIGGGSTPMFMQIQNTSATVSYHVVISLDFNHGVDSSGTDAYAYSQFTLKNGASEVFFTHLESDTVNASRNRKNADLLMTLGGPVTDSGIVQLGFDIAAGSTLQLDGAWTLEGGNPDGTATSFFDVFAEIDLIRALNQPPNPNPAPLPGTLALLGLGAGLLARSRRHRTH